jgi:hypothetical protein
VRARSVVFVLTGLTGAVLFAGSLGSASGAHDARGAGGGHGDAHGGHGGETAAALTRPAGVAATFAAVTGLSWLVSRRERAGSTAVSGLTSDAAGRAAGARREDAAPGEAPRSEQGDTRRAGG